MKNAESSAADPEDLQLAIEASGRTGSVALLRGEHVLRQCHLPVDQRTAASLAVELQATLRWCREHQSPPRYLSVAVGPGSFTGLRIGVTAAKTLSYALKLPLVAVDSLAAIAATAAIDHPRAERLLVGVSAYRGQVFSALFDRPALIRQPLTQQSASNDSGPPAGESEILGRDAWTARWGQADTDIFFTGDPAVFSGCSPERFLQRSTCDAVGAGRMALAAALAGRWSDPIALTPRYLRPSAAEESASGSSTTRA